MKRFVVWALNAACWCTHWMLHIRGLWRLPVVGGFVGRHKLAEWSGYLEGRWGLLEGVS